MSDLLRITNLTGAYTVVRNDSGKILNCTANSFTITLTAAATLKAGFNCWIWNTASLWGSTITIDANASETIDGLLTLSLQLGEGVQLICDGTNWYTGAGKEVKIIAENTSPGETRPVASAYRTLAIGVNASASASDAVAVKGTASGSTAFAAMGTASGTNSVAVGQASNAVGTNAIAIGMSTATPNYSIAIGANSSGNGAVATTGVGSVAIGGSYASGTDSFAAAVANNTNIYGALGSSSIAFGLQAKASNTQAFSVGYQSVASGSSAIAIGDFSTASGGDSISLGRYSKANKSGKVAVNNGGVFTAAGDSQKGLFILRAETVDATATAITATATAASSTNQVVLDNDTLYGFSGTLVCRNTANNSDCIVWMFKGAIARGANAASTRLIGTPIVELLGSDGSVYTFTLTADTTNGGLAITVTGAAATTLRWVATVETTEVVG